MGRMRQAQGNNIGLLRLVLASLVIISHAPQMIDGDARREPMTMIVHTTASFGGLAVEGFFLLSGYLITKSMLSTGAVGPYMVRRVLRIWPAYLAAFLISVFCLSPLLGGAPWRHLGRTFAALAVMRAPPTYPGLLKGLPYPVLNGSMWTIAYEFRCYVMVALMFMLGLLRRKWLCLGLAVLLIAGMIAETVPSVAQRLYTILPFHLTFVLGDAWQTIRLTAAFAVGMCAYLFWDRVSGWLNGWTVAACAVAMVLLLFVQPLAEAGMITFGAVVLFWLAMVARLGVLQRINDRWDISYGVYLYGWPVATTILYFHRDIGPATLAVTALLVSGACGAASWWGLERWAKNLFPSQHARREVTSAGAAAQPASAAA
jgi:peptidoglycan/LPS O-acetylase OafA/YrhL